MPDNGVKESVLAFLKSKGSIPGTSEADHLSFAYLDNGLLDSMGIVEMVITFEEQFSIRFSPEDMQSAEFRTIGGLVSTIQRLRERPR